LRKKRGTREEPPPLHRAGSGAATLTAFAADPGRRSRREEMPRGGALGSLGLHLALLLALLIHPPAPTPQPWRPIPLKLVMIKPPPKPAPKPPPKPAPKPVTKPPPKPPPAAERPPQGRIASRSMGENPEKAAQAPKPAAKKPAAAPEPAKAPAPPEPSKPASPTAKAAPGKAPPKPPFETATAVPRPREKPPAPAKTRSAHRRGRPVAVARAEALPQYPGPSASRSAYLAYLAALIRRHIGLLPRTMVGDRRGVAIIGITVMDDGRIAQLYVIKSSGDPDIDLRIEMMVSAVGRFPPLPQLWQGPKVDLDFHFPFPDALPR
jgi:outer membrane biosynthesis protein TonB